MSADAWNNLVVAIEHAGGSMRCELRDGRCISLPARWRGQIAISERLHIDPGVNSVDRSTSLYAERHRRADLAQIPVLAASPPHQDRRGTAFVILDADDDAQNEVKHVLVESAQIRDYFFAPDRSVPWENQANWFEILGATESSSPAELRLAHRVQCLACTADGRDSAAPVTQLARGFEILMNPELRSHYLALIHDPSFPVAFPPWTVGCLVATGEKQDATFLVHRLIRFIPAMEKQTVRLALRRLRFEGSAAVYRDARRKLLLRFDAGVLPLMWNDEWSNWAHLTLGSMKITATFWQQMRFRRKGGSFEPVIWHQPLASSLSVQSPEELASRFEQARLFWQRFHPHADAVALLRARIEREPAEAGEAEQWCLAHGVPGPIDTRLINWEPDYEECYYRELASRAQRIYLFRNEYLFIAERTVITEIPQRGHASYVFRPPGSLADFLRHYARTTRQEIRRNAESARKVLGYQRRIPHLQDPATWLKNILDRSARRDAGLHKCHGSDTTGGEK